MLRVPEHLHRLPRAGVESPSLETPKSHLDMVLGKQLLVSLLEQGGEPGDFHPTSDTVNSWSHFLILSVAASAYNINPSFIMINKIALIPEGSEGSPKHSVNLLQEELRKCFISSNHISLKQ